MQRYTYIFRDPAGNYCTGTMQADSGQAVLEHLRRNGQQPLSIELGGEADHDADPPRPLLTGGRTMILLGCFALGAVFPFLRGALRARMLAEGSWALLLMPLGCGAAFAAAATFLMVLERCRRPASRVAAVVAGVSLATGILAGASTLLGPR